MKWSDLNRTPPGIQSDWCAAATTTFWVQPGRQQQRQHSSSEQRKLSRSIASRENCAQQQQWLPAELSSLHQGRVLSLPLSLALSDNVCVCVGANERARWRCVCVQAGGYENWMRRTGATARFVQAAYTHMYTSLVFVCIWSIFMGSISRVVVISCCAPHTHKHTHIPKGPKNKKS